GAYPVEVHRAVVESDLTVYVNARYFRGFSGGWKSVCVGLSTYRSIKIHHTPDGMSMSLHANRMHALLDEMGRHLEARTGRRVFKIDTVAAGPFATARVFAGSVEATRRAALTTLETLFPPRRGLAHRQFDVFVYGVPDWSPYAIWSTTNPILTLVSSGLGYLGGVIEALGRPGCTVIMATPAPDRWDTARHPAYREVWERVLPVTRDPYRIMREYADAFAARPDYVEQYRHAFAFHPVHAIMALYPLKRLARVGRVIVAAPEDPRVPRHLGFEVAASVEAAIRQADAPDVDRAVRAARRAFADTAWSRMAARERAKLLWKVGDLIVKNADELAKLETQDNGKPIFESRYVDIPAAAETFYYYAGWCTKIEGATIPVPGDFFNYTLREPYGVCGIITPWNFPLLMVAWKVAPALACGNTVVVKVAEETPLSGLRLGQLCQEAGLPDGVVNIVPGFGETAGRALVAHPAVDKISFTGSTAVGKEIMRTAADTLKKVSLELGGK